MSIALRLKQLREAANPTVSLRQMASALGIDYSTYAHYENVGRFKKPRLELGLAQQIASVLSDHGIEPRRVMELAGVFDSDAPMPLSLAKERWLARFDRLTSTQRRLLEQLADEMAGPEAADDDPDADQAPGGTVHSPVQDYRAGA